MCFKKIDIRLLINGIIIIKTVLKIILLNISILFKFLKFIFKSYFLKQLKKLYIQTHPKFLIFKTAAKTRKSKWHQNTISK